MLIEFQAVEEGALKAVGTMVRSARMDLRELECGVFKLEETPQLKKTTLENWELALTWLY